MKPAIVILAGVAATLAGYAYEQHSRMVVAEWLVCEHISDHTEWKDLDCDARLRAMGRVIK